MLLVFLLIGVLVILGASLVISGRWSDQVSGEDRPDPAPIPRSGEWDAESLSDVRFRTALRGYHMEDVDAALASMAQQLATEGTGGAKPEIDTVAPEGNAQESEGQSAPDGWGFGSKGTGTPE